MFPALILGLLGIAMIATGASGFPDFEVALLLTLQLGFVGLIVAIGERK